MDERTVVGGSPWSRSPDDTLRALDTSPRGLTTAEAERRLSLHGLNEVEAHAEVSVVGLLLKQFANPIVALLLFATVVAGILGEVADALLIALIVVASGVLGFAQEYRAGSAAAALRQRVMVRATVRRDNKATDVPTNQVVPGDVVVLNAGDLVPGDALLLAARDLYVNQAVLTGETLPEAKHAGVVPADAPLPERTNVVFLGTSVRSGTGEAVVFATGRATAFGSIAHHVARRPPETTFERGITRFGLLLTQLMMALLLLILAFNVSSGAPVIDSLLFSLALAVGITPQLLPAILAITMSRGSHAMAREGVIVRQLEAIENFGAMDILCSDKTGTLTLGEMTLESAVDAEGASSARVLELAALNATFQTGIDNPLDAALVRAAPDLSGWTKVDEVPYDFVRKRLSVAVRRAVTAGEAPQGTLLVVKGAVSNVLDACAPDTPRAALERRFEEWSRSGYRVLAVATRSLGAVTTVARADEADLVFAGFLLFVDPIKPDVKDVLAQLTGLGISLKIISGDNRFVVGHIAAQAGLDQRLLTGPELAVMSDEALGRAARSTALFAEVDPNQKERVLLALKKGGHTVGYLGDGINDAPALHASDVGISVESAADVAQQAADIVCLRKDLAVLVRGVVLGRAAFANTLKYLFVTLSANLGNMMSMAVASTFLPFLPLTPLQLMINNVLTDMPAAAIGGDAVDPEAVERPGRWDVGQLRSFMLRFGALSSAFDLLTFAVLLRGLGVGMVAFRTGWFIESALTEIVSLLVLRSRRPAFRSRPSRGLVVASAGIAVTVLVLPYLPFAGAIGFAPLGPAVLAAVLLITLAYGGATELAKRAFFRRA